MNLRSCHSKYAGSFLLVGIIMTYGLMFLMTARSPFAGMGDGSGQHGESPSPEGCVLPYSSYFLCGLIAACSARRWVRIVAAVIAHSAPFITLAFANPVEKPFFIVIDLLTFTVFGFAWFQILKKDDHAA
ncbi:MAG TPA: hypothetical protein VKU37_05105 [Verrucomicrobiae bacterium]|nr:hypothetical protein [Verrucomicrobiae bacterium]